MSDPTNPVAPAAKARPSSVTISSYLLFLVAAIQVIGFIVALSVLGTIRTVYEEAFAGTNMAGSAGTVGTVSIIGAAVVGLLIAVGLVVLGTLNNRGKNASRIVTWVLGGLFLCCSGAGLAISGAGSTMNMGSTGGANVPDQAAIQRMLEARLPGWYTPVTITLSVISLIALLVALILLALPASNEFFRKRPAAWEPPMPGSTYPGYPQSGSPGYPPSADPGYPQTNPPTNPPGGPSAPPPPPPNPPGS